MTRLLFAALILNALPTAALAQMSAAEFDAYTKGRTLTFLNQGRAYGVEEYFENRRVRWSFLDGRCQEGRWYEQAGEICFVYEYEPSPQCWIFTETARGLRAELGGEGGLELYEAQETDEPMLCIGPDVGV